MYSPSAGKEFSSPTGEASQGLCVCCVTVFRPLLWCPHNFVCTICLLPTAVVVQSPRRVQLLVTPWTAARQASLSFTVSRSLLKLRSIELVMPSSRDWPPPSLVNNDSSASLSSLGCADSTWHFCWPAVTSLASSHSTCLKPDSSSPPP